MPQTVPITILDTPDFKAYLISDAAREGISLSELVRRRCMAKPVELPGLDVHDSVSITLHDHERRLAWLEDMLLGVLAKK